MTNNIIETIIENGSTTAIKVSDISKLDLGFEFLNPVQSSFVKHDLHKKDCNLIASWPTSTGKTVVAELIIEQTTQQGYKAIYACPLKSLAEEKIRRFKKLYPYLNIEIFTGDHRDFERRKEKAERADIAIVTTELLDSISRNKRLIKCLINETKALIVDEAHILGTERGGVVEGALIRITEYNENIKIIFLSATVPNTQEIAEWIWSLNGKKTYILESEYRPVDIDWHIFHIKPARPLGLWKQIAAKEVTNHILELLDYDPESQILVFVWTKKEGELLEKKFNEFNIPCLFHNASLEFEDRLNFETKFENKEIKVLISTTTLAWGRNTCARYVFIFGDRRGITRVPGWDVIQMGGRAGRTGMAPKGDVFWYVSNIDYAQDILSNPPEIKSSLQDEKRLAFQLIGQMPYNQEIIVEELFLWYLKTLVVKQCMEHEYISLFNRALDILIKDTGCVAYNSIAGTLKLTNKGKIARRFYVHPLEINCWHKILKNIDEANLEDKLNTPAGAFSVFFAHTQIQPDLFLTEEEKIDLWKCKDETFNIFYTRNVFLGDIHAFTTYHGLRWYTLTQYNGKSYPHFKIRSYLWDLERIGQVCVCLANEVMNNKEVAEILQKMMVILSYGAPLEAYDLLKIRGIGAKRARDLLSQGIKTREELFEVLQTNKEQIEKILPSNIINDLEHEIQLSMAF